jgi:hypothetical protein
MNKRDLRFFGRSETKSGLQVELYFALRHQPQAPSYVEMLSIRAGLVLLVTVKISINSPSSVSSKTRKVYSWGTPVSQGFRSQEVLETEPAQKQTGNDFGTTRNSLAVWLRVFDGLYELLRHVEWAHGYDRRSIVAE